MNMNRKQRRAAARNDAKPSAASTQYLLNIIGALTERLGGEVRLSQGEIAAKRDIGWAPEDNNILLLTSFRVDEDAPELPGRKKE